MTTDTPETKDPQDQSEAPEDQASEPEASPAKGHEDTPDDPSRRTFFKRVAIGGGAAVVAGGAFAYGNYRAKGIPHEKIDDFLPISDDYKPFDQRSKLQTFTLSKQLPEQFPERVAAWEKAAKERGGDLQVKGSAEKFKKGNVQKDKPGWTQLDYALDKAAWQTSFFQAGYHAYGDPRQGVFGWEQKDLAETKWQFESPQDAAVKIKTAAKLFGAVRCGIAPRDHRFDYDPLYSTSEERTISWDEFYEEAGFVPKSVIVCLVSMDYEAMATAPSVIQSATAAQGYSEMTVVAGQLARFLRELGCKAVGSGNDLGNNVAYAVTAGLGECARAGWLIAPSLGPRVRICKVYTELDANQVAYDKPRFFNIESFCLNCKRCADVCPAQAITHGPKTMQPAYEGADDPNYAWSSNPGAHLFYNDMKKCFEFWVDNGGDCGSCISICPYNKPDFWHHDFVDSVQTLFPGPVHAIMREFDILFGYGHVGDVSRTKKFWKLGKHMNSG